VNCDRKRSGRRREFLGDRHGRYRSGRERRRGRKGRRGDRERGFHRYERRDGVSWSNGERRSWRRDRRRFVERRRRGERFGVSNFFERQLGQCDR